MSLTSAFLFSKEAEYLRRTHLHLDPQLTVVLFSNRFLFFLRQSPYLWLSNRNGMKVCQPLTKQLHCDANDMVASQRIAQGTV